MESQAKTHININYLQTPQDSGSSHCGYCKKPKEQQGHKSWDIYSQKMRVDDYQKLMDRGWRRCGFQFYKWDLTQSCCQPYTIRLDVNQYAISDSQKKVLKKFNNFLQGKIGMDGKSTQVETKKTETKILDQQKLSRISEEISKFCLDNEIEVNLSGTIISQARGEFRDTKSWSCNTLLRLYHLNEKLKQEILPIFIQSKLKQFTWSQDVIIEDSGYMTFINKEKNEISKQEKKETQEKQEKDRGNFQEYFWELVPFQGKAAHTYTIELQRAVCTKEKFKVYEKYQQAVHKSQKESQDGFNRFLCNSPLYDHRISEERQLKVEENMDQQRILQNEGTFPQARGSYHMLHRIDGELVMVGVLDITDFCVSSVYLFYDPKYEFLSPGTLSAIREIEYVKKCKQLGSPESFHWYYMGLYFQTCQKSVYKANFKPSQVACPSTFTFVPLTDEVKEKIRTQLKAVLSDVKTLEVQPNDAFSQGMRTVLVSSKDQKQTLSVREINPKFKHIFTQMLPSIYTQMGLDLNVEFNF